MNEIGKIEEEKRNRLDLRPKNRKKKGNTLVVM